jgi:hypothetical protein
VVAAQNIVQLRQLLAQRFGGVWSLPEAPQPKPAHYIATGLPQLDEALGGGLPKGNLTELLCPIRQMGSGLVLRWLVQQLSCRGLWLALIDGLDSFDPAGLEQATLARLLWVRCQQAIQAIQAADLLLQDSQAPVVVLDLRLNPAQHLRAIPHSAWYRLQRLVDPTETALVVLTAQPWVSTAQARVELGGRFGLDALDQDASGLLARVQVKVLLHRAAAQPAEPLVAHAS